MRLIMFIVVFLLSQSCYAVLPPFYQGAKEVTAILNNAEVADKISSGRVIKKIERTDTGYRITANECTLDVIVNYQPPKEGMVGPAEFTISAQELMCPK